MSSIRLLGPRAVVASALIIVPALVVLAMTEGCKSGSGLSSPSGDSAKPPSSPAVRTLEPVSTADLDRYVGSKLCVTCHADQKAQLASRHAHTLRTTASPEQPAVFKNGSLIHDPQLGTTYEPHVADGRCVVTVTFGDRREVIAPKWVFGSGHRGFSYLASRRGMDAELHVSYYSKEKFWDLTPGQLGRPREITPLGDPLDQEELSRCFLCHTTALAYEAKAVKPERSIMGVGCEACHGPGREHVEAAKRRDADLKMATLSSDRRFVSEKLCNQCHRPLVNAEIVAGDPHLPRFQGTALGLSACFTKSKGALSCLTCHDPHRNADARSRPQYNTICTSCHVPSESKKVPCKVQPAGDCVSCHMPAQIVPMPNSPVFRTHWIKVWENSGSTAAAPG
jgi:hypothetical protein